MTTIVTVYASEISAVEFDPKEKYLAVEFEEDDNHRMMQILDAAPTSLEDLYMEIINEDVTQEWLRNCTEWRWI